MPSLDWLNLEEGQTDDISLPIKDDFENHYYRKNGISVLYIRMNETLRENLVSRTLLDRWLQEEEKEDEEEDWWLLTSRGQSIRVQLTT